VTDIEAARELEAHRLTTSGMLHEALGLGAYALRNKAARRGDVKELLALLGAVSVKDAIQKLDGKEEGCKET
jgi:hypothetical protein